MAEFIKSINIQKGNSGVDQNLKWCGGGNWEQWVRTEKGEPYWEAVLSQYNMKTGKNGTLWANAQTAEQLY